MTGALWTKRNIRLDEHLAREVFKCTLAEFPGAVRPSWTRYFHRKVNTSVGEVLGKTLGVMYSATSGVGEGRSEPRRSHTAMGYDRDAGRRRGIATLQHYAS